MADATRTLSLAAVQPYLNLRYNAMRRRYSNGAHQSLVTESSTALPQPALHCNVQKVQVCGLVICSGSGTVYGMHILMCIVAYHTTAGRGRQILLLMTTAVTPFTGHYVKCMPAKQWYTSHLLMTVHPCNTTSMA
jgi:hypothetical protein